ncbi:hypothetical protein NDU88_004233 [Pleurodeles waltl]|uniref:Uncharacterized protein n=1 Tax=Pleurodeles waltl TaxID=8319 RepID=A0AAV7VK53_PLEWA|nr:hypothetical protein NDU88_004233 [Pleurodeles waltl]
MHIRSSMQDSLMVVACFSVIMPPKKASTPKGKGRDPELSQLLRLVLEKLGSDDAIEVNGSPEKDVSRDRCPRPKRSHVVPSAAFPPVKRSRKGKTPGPASLNQAPSTAVSQPAQMARPEPPAPTSPSGAPPTPLPGVVPPAPYVPPAARVPEQQAQTQDPSRLALLEVSRLFASINPPTSNTPLPTTPWGSSDSLQNSLHDLKLQVEALAVPHTSNSLQASANSPSVTQTPSAILASSPIVQNALPRSSKAHGQDNHTKEGTTDALLSRPARKLAKERALGRLVGPFKSPPLAGFVCSPLGVVPKKEPGQFRLIHNLSAPKGSSVNDAIDPQLCSVHYASVDNVVEKVRALGHGAWLAKNDIELAFRLLPVHPD